MLRYTYWQPNDSYYFHIGRKNNNGSISRMAFTKKEGEAAYEFLKEIYGQVVAARKGELIPALGGNMNIATMDKSKEGFWDESPYCFRSIGLVIRVGFNTRTEGHVVHFLRPYRNNETKDTEYSNDYIKPTYIGSSFYAPAPAVKDFIHYMKKKLRA